MRIAATLVVVSLLAARPGAAAAADETFQLFQEEAKVVSASFQPQRVDQAPATVYVVTSEQIKDSGAQTLWDALRGVPGVDVIETRAFQGEVGIRGLNGTLNNRVLVLLDGRTVLDGLFDFVTWETIPVTLEEIARIEVVEGPASALYGANAVSGVINIISKTPEQLSGGGVTYSGGGAGTRFGTALYGTRKGKLDYKIGLGERSGNGFENESRRSSRTEKVDALVGYDFSPDSRLSLSFGLTQANTETDTGGTGTAFVHGLTAFSRADYRYKDTTLKAFWNHERLILDDFGPLAQPNLDADSFNASLQHTLYMPHENTLVVGGSYTRDAVRSKVLQSGLLSQDRWALFFEDQWKPADRWTVVASGRLDRHPLTPLGFSPRISVLFAPVDGQVWRLSAGTAFRNPTALESYLRFSQSVPNPAGGALPNPPFTTINAALGGNPQVEPERMRQAEAAYSGRFGPVQTTATAFYYRLDGLIASTPEALVSAVPPTVNLTSSYFNHGGTTALGFELGAEARPWSWLTAFANYSYQSLKDDDPSTQTSARSAPRHKVNAGFRTKRAGWTTSLWADWVDHTDWNAAQVGSPLSFSRVPAYAMLSGRVGYAFSGAWDGLELAVSAFNMTDAKHYEILRSVSPILPGQSGEIVRSRWMGTVAYRF